MASRASNLAGFVTSISPPSNLNVGVVTASSFVGNVTGNVTVGVLTATTISAGSTTGTSGQLLQSTGTGVTWTAAPNGLITEQASLIGYNSAGIRSDSANGRLAVFGTGNFQVFTSPGTFVVNPGISSIRVRVVGAGGNGGTGGSTPSTPGSLPTTSTASGGGGGGGGGYAHKVITSFTAPRAYTVTVGTAPGGTSSFGPEVSATGGSNGSNGTPSPGTAPIPPSPGGAGGAGGSSIGGDVNYTGATGTAGADRRQPGAGPGAPGGAGGASATQLGNGSGQTVPGLPANSKSANRFGVYVAVTASLVTIDTAEITSGAYSRFPFDIFDGYDGASEPFGYPVTSPGFNPIVPYITPLLNGFRGGKGGFLNTDLGRFIGESGDGAGGNGGDGAGWSPNTPTSSGKNAGLGGGGGGGGGGAPPAVRPDANVGQPGGSGSSGIVIVEW